MAYYTIPFIGTGSYEYALDLRVSIRLCTCTITLLYQTKVLNYFHIQAFNCTFKRNTKLCKNVRAFQPTDRFF